MSIPCAWAIGRSRTRCGPSPNRPARGVFGVPTLIVDDELLWGADAMGFVEAYLADPGILATEDMKRATHLPIGAARRRD